MPAPHFLVHDRADSVGVIVVENVKPGAKLSGWAMDADKTVAMISADAIPLGHKIALRAIKKGETVLKYGHDIGRAVADIKQGGHVHVHNIKTKRW